MATDQQTTGQRRRWKWLKRIAVVVGVPLALLVGVYLWYGVKVWFGVPKLSRDYAAELRAAAEAIPEDQRAWPLLREAAMGIERAPQVREPHPEIFENWMDLLRVEPRHLNWPRLVQYVECHGDQLDLLRRAAERPFLGYTTVGLFDAEFEASRWGRSVDEVRREHQEWVQPFPPFLQGVPTYVGSTVGWDLGQEVGTAQQESLALLIASMKRAAFEGDADRFSTDLRAHRRIARLSAELPLQRWWTRTWSAELFAALRDAFVDRNLRFSDSQLRSIQNALMLDSPGAIASDVLRAQQRDFNLLLDGSFAGGVAQPQILWPYWWTTNSYERTLLSRLQLSWAGRPLLAAAFPTRSEAERRFSRSLARIERNEAMPPWERQKIRLPTWSPESEAADGAVRSGVSPPPLVYVHGHGRYFPNEQLLWRPNGVERDAGRRDGVVVGIALELFRRANGDYPYTLDELVPEFLESVPVDIFDGRPLRFMMAGPESPVVYSVGTDRDDDGGRMPDAWAHDEEHEGNDRASRWFSEEWRAKYGAIFDEHYNGDWILWPVIARREWR